MLSSLHRDQKGLLLSPVYKLLKGIFQRWFCQRTKFCCFFCHCQVLLIFLIHLSLSNQYFYTIRSVAMILKVLTKVKFKVVAQTEIISSYWHTPVRKFSELLAINHIWSERRIILVPWLLKFYHVLVFYNLHGCALPRSWDVR